MATKIAILLLAFAASVLTQAPQPCNRLGRFCVSPAQCIDKECQCPASTYGDGMINCVENGYGHCVITADPKIRPFPGDSGKSALFLPCRHTLAKFIVQIGDTEEYCRFTVYGTSELVSTGRYFEGEVEVSISVGTKPSDDDSQYVERDTIYFRVTTDEVRRTTSSSGFMSNTYSWTVSEYGENFDVDFNGVAISMNFDDTRRATLRAEDCDTEITFRPFNPGEKPQKFMPGISIVSPPSATFNDPFCRHPHTLCDAADSEDSFIQNQADLRGLSKKDLYMYSSLRHAPMQNRGVYKYECHLARTIFRDQCTEVQRKRAVKVCGDIMCRQRTVKCLLDQPTSYNPMDVFAKCLDAVCNDNFYSCRTFLQFLTKCKKSKALQRFQCTRGSLVDSEGNTVAFENA